MSGRICSWVVWNVTTISFRSETEARASAPIHARPFPTRNCSLAAARLRENRVCIGFGWPTYEIASRRQNLLSPKTFVGDPAAVRQNSNGISSVLRDDYYSTEIILAGCHLPPSSSRGRSPCFFSMSCAPNGDCGVMMRISCLSCTTSVPPARGPMK